LGQRDKNRSSYRFSLFFFFFFVLLWAWQGWESIRPQLELLAGPHEQLRRAIPTRSLLDQPVEDAGARARLQELLKKVDHMRSLRTTEVEALRAKVPKLKKQTNKQKTNVFNL
jgi:hypothetical protein